jgi:hypothetical protein
LTGDLHKVMLSRSCLFYRHQITVKNDRKTIFKE